MKRRCRVAGRRWMRRVLRIHDTPHSIAMGASIGVFMGWGPLYGLHTVAALVIAALSRVNKAAAVLAVWTNNPLTTAPILYLEYLLGTLIVPGASARGGWEAIVELGRALGRISLLHFRESMNGLAESVKAMGWGIFWPWLVGSLITCTALAALVYPATRREVIHHRRHAEERRAERHRRLAAERAGKAGVKST